MPNLYTRKLYDLLMSKLNISRYVKKQTSVTASELHDQRAKWEDAGMKLPAPLAAFHIGKPSLCTFWNHAKGAGCKREKDGKKCDRDHKCMWCGSATHGAYMRLPTNSGSGIYQCPFYEGIRVELQSLGIDATISDLDDFVEDLRTHGIPSENLGSSGGASIGSSSRFIAKSAGSTASSIAPGALKEHHVPVGGVPVNRTKATKRPKKDAAAHASAPTSHAPGSAAPSLIGSGSSEPYSNQITSSGSHHPAPISKPGSSSNIMHSSSSNIHNASHGSFSSGDANILGTSPASQLFDSPPSSSLFDYDTSDHNGTQSYYNDLALNPIDSLMIGGRHGPTALSSASVYAPGPADHDNSSSSSTSASTSTAMHLVMNTQLYCGATELRIHTPMHRTQHSLIYGATYTHNWLSHPSEVVVKLSLLSTDPTIRKKQQERLESEYRVYSTFSKMNHPHLLSILGRESIIESGLDQYALLAMEKTDFNLAQFFHEFLPNNMTLFQQHRLFQQQMSSGQPFTLPAMTPLYRALSNQLINTYLLLHLHDRYHQRSIDPSNIYISSTAVGACYSSMTLDKETPNLKISDFSFYEGPSGGSIASLGGVMMHGVSTLASSIDAQYQGFLSPEASRASVPFGLLVHPGSISGSNIGSATQPLHHQYASQPPFDGKASDLFSIGSLLYYIVSGGYVLFASESERDDAERRNAYLKRHHVDKSDPMLLDMINRLTLPNPGDRPPLDVIRHHPSLWKPHTVVDFICMVSNELEGPNTELARLIWDILGSNDFFSHAFPKADHWRDHIPAAWLTSWTEWVHLQHQHLVNQAQRSSGAPLTATAPLSIVNTSTNDQIAPGTLPGTLNFRSVRQLLRCLTVAADHLPGGITARTHFGNLIIRRLHFLVISLWSHLQQIGTFDEVHKFSFIG